MKLCPDCCAASHEAGEWDYCPPHAKWDRFCWAWWDIGMEMHPTYPVSTHDTDTLDFLDEFAAERTAANPDFPALVAEAEASRFDPAARAAEKQASRDMDAADLASGRKTVEQLHRENGAFAFPADRVRINWRGIAKCLGRPDATAEEIKAIKLPPLTEDDL